MKLGLLVVGWLVRGLWFGLGSGRLTLGRGSKQQAGFWRVLLFVMFGRV